MGEGGKHDHGSQTKVLHFLLSVGIRNARTGRLTESPFLGHNPTTHCFGRKEIGITQQKRGKGKANGEVATVVLLAPPPKKKKKELNLPKAELSCPSIPTASP